MKRKTIDLVKFVELYTPFSEIGGWYQEKHDRKHDVYDYLYSIERINIQCRKDGYPSLMGGNHSFTVLRLPRLQSGKLKHLRGQWILMRLDGRNIGNYYVEVYKLRSTPTDELFTKMEDLNCYSNNQNHYEEMEEFYIERKNAGKSRVYILAFIDAYRPIKAVCKVCTTKTTYSGNMSFNTSEGHQEVDQFQCQDCGELSYDERTSEDIVVACLEPCDCGGQRRRDKNIFCPGCGYRKRKNNKTESFTTISQVELDILETKHESILEHD